MSKEWKRFTEEYFGKSRMEYDGGIDISTVTFLNGEERKKAEDLLIKAMIDGGYYPIIGLRELKSKKAIPVMKQLLSEIDPIRGIEIAISLNELEGTTEYISYILNFLSEDYHWTIRRTAARRLALYGTPSVTKALYSTLKDNEYLVRYAAAESLLLIHGIERELSFYTELHTLLSIREEGIGIDEAYQKKATTLLREIIKQEKEK
ncbi:MAG: hypothetical protein GF411_15730 [Candidatus Lokiarchaeota archaeon]|nr:hypothetical protein [Candidatus Lokiarchaeota archaeon]